jgi:hypothetical protein
MRKVIGHANRVETFEATSEEVIEGILNGDLYCYKTICGCWLYVKMYVGGGNKTEIKCLSVPSFSIYYNSDFSIRETMQNRINEGTIYKIDSIKELL